MKTMLKSALLAAAVLAPAQGFAQTVPGAVVAVVDTDRITRDCNACKAAATQIQALVTQAQQRAQALGTPLQTEGQAIQAEAQRVNGLPQGAARTAAENALRQRVQALEARQGAGQQELGRLQQNLQSVNANVLRQINERMGPIIQQVMQQRGANIAISQDATLAIARNVDITDGVLTALNTALPSVSVTPLPTQQQPAQNRPAAPGR